MPEVTCVPSGKVKAIHDTVAGIAATASSEEATSVPSSDFTYTRTVPTAVEERPIITSTLSRVTVAEIAEGLVTMPLTEGLVTIPLAEGLVPNPSAFCGSTPGSLQEISNAEKHAVNIRFFKKRSDVQHLSAFESRELYCINWF
jgi:hypothetical protein